MDSTLAFQELEHDFLHYMMKFGGIAKKTSHDYVSRMRFLSQSYVLDQNITEEYVKHIMDEERKAYADRSKYNTKKALGDFKSGLRKFLEFIKSDYIQNRDDAILSEIRKVEENTQLTPTQRTQIIKSRVGQGSFRR